MIASCLSAIEPDRLGVVDDDREAGSGGRVFGWDETGEEAAFERMAGVGEARLSDCVILGEEIELDCSADGSGDVVRAVLEDTICSDSDLDGVSCLSADGRSRDGGEAKEGIGELHYE